MVTSNIKRSETVLYRTIFLIAGTSFYAGIFVTGWGLRLSGVWQVDWITLGLNAAALICFIALCVLNFRAHLKLKAEGQ